MTHHEPTHGRFIPNLVWGVAVGAIVAFTHPAAALGPLDSLARGKKFEPSSSPVPLDSRLSSPFGWRMGRTGKARMFHAAVDFAAKTGTPVFAARGGVVLHVAKNSRRCQGFCGYGNAVVVYHLKEDTWTLYGHLSKVDVEVGDKVVAGEKIGAVGATSNGRFRGMGAHLHFEVRRRLESGAQPYPGKPRAGAVDPRGWLAGLGVVYDERGFAVR